MGRPRAARGTPPKVAYGSCSCGLCGTQRHACAVRALGGPWRGVMHHSLTAHSAHVHCARRFAKYDEAGDPSLIYPPAYTSCVQQLDNGAWMIPCWEPQAAAATATEAYQTATQQGGTHDMAAGGGGKQAGQPAQEVVGRVRWLCARPMPAA